MELDKRAMDRVMVTSMRCRRTGTLALRWSADDQSVRRRVEASYIGQLWLKRISRPIDAVLAISASAPRTRHIARGRILLYVFQDDQPNEDTRQTELPIPSLQAEHCDSARSL
jgi:hypothetical protein